MAVSIWSLIVLRIKTTTCTTPLRVAGVALTIHAHLGTPDIQRLAASSTPACCGDLVGTTLEPYRVDRAKVHHCPSIAPGTRQQLAAWIDSA